MNYEEILCFLKKFPNFPKKEKFENEIFEESKKNLENSNLKYFQKICELLEFYKDEKIVNFRSFKKISYVNLFTCNPKLDRIKFVNFIKFVHILVIVPLIFLSNFCDKKWNRNLINFSSNQFDARFIFFRLFGIFRVFKYILFFKLASIIR